MTAERKCLKMQELAAHIALHHQENLRSIGNLGKELGYGG